MVMRNHYADDEIPELVSESEDEGVDAEQWETSSSTSSVDSVRGFFETRYHEDHDESTNAGEDSDSASTSSNITSANSDCSVCLKPRWCKSFSPTTHHCRDYCTHKVNANNLTPDDAPTMEKSNVMPNFAMSMMPEDVEEISSHKHGAYSSSADLPPELHREKQHPKGDQLDPLIAWYNLVAKPVPRKLWETNARAMTAVNNEWDKLRKADGGKGTWDEGVVRE